METLERKVRDRRRSSVEGVSGLPQEQLTRMRSDGERLLAAGSEAIRRALARDTEEFLSNNRQASGE